MCFRTTQPPYRFLQLQFEKSGKYVVSPHGYPGHSGDGQGRVSPGKKLNQRERGTRFTRQKLSYSLVSQPYRLDYII